jgi:amino acid transporter
LDGGVVSEPLITTVADASRSADKGLKKGAIGLVGSVVVATASTAPAYSLAAALGFIVADGTGGLLAGRHAPIIVLLAFIPMYFIAQSYKELNEVDPDCGTTFTWSTRAFGAVTGWMGGWAIVVADLIVMANLAYVAGQYTFVFIGGFGLPAVAALAGNIWASTFLGLLWIAVMTWICYRGIEMFAFTALGKVAAGNGVPGHSIAFSWEWFNPFTMDFGSAFAPALLSAIFIYWGWDSAVSVNEETKDPTKTPGRAAVLSTGLLLVTYLLVTIATVSYAGVGDKGIGLANPDTSDDVFSAMAPSVFGGGFLGHALQILFALTILTSASASTQTTILPTARTTLSMAVHKAMPSQFARIHPRYLTPSWSTIGMGVVSAALFLLFTWISVDLLNALIYSLGLMIAFYYGLTGLACVWFFRRTLLTSVRRFVFRGLIPFLGAAILAVIFVYGVIAYAAPDYFTDDKGNDVTVFGIGIVAFVGVVGLLLGFVLMAAWALVNREFFRGGVIRRRAFVEGQEVVDANRVTD